MYVVGDLGERNRTDPARRYTPEAERLTKFVEGQVVFLSNAAV